MINKTENSEMKTLVMALNSMIKKGYTENFKVTDMGLEALDSGKVYSPQNVRVTDFYRFEGTSDPGDESILYGIETDDHKKGTLVDAFGPHADIRVTEFMHQVEEISKKNTSND